MSSSDFERSTPTNGIPVGHSKCKVCGEIIATGLISMARHWSQCGGKFQYDQMKIIGDKYMKKEITEAQFHNSVKILFEIPDKDFPYSPEPPNENGETHLS